MLKKTKICFGYFRRWLFATQKSGQFQQPTWKIALQLSVNPGQKPPLLLYKGTVLGERKKQTGRAKIIHPNHIGLTHGAPETGFFRESVGQNEVFSSKNAVSLVGCVSPVISIPVVSEWFNREGAKFEKREFNTGRWREDLISNRGVIDPDLVPSDLEKKWV